MLPLHIAIVVVSYNRPTSLNRLLTSLSLAYYPTKSIELIISIDYSGSNDCSEIASNYVWGHGIKYVVSHDVKLGLRKHIISVGNYL